MLGKATMTKFKFVIRRATMFVRLHRNVHSQLFKYSISPVFLQVITPKIKLFLLLVTSQSNFHLSLKTGSCSQTTNYARIKSETFREEEPHDEKIKTSHSRRPY